MIDGHFAIVATAGQTVRLARSPADPLRYFIASRSSGPILVAADRIDAIFRYLQAEGLADQFHPSYTRMVPAHYITEVALVGCPDPNPIYRRFFLPPRATLPPNPDVIGEQYIQALSEMQLLSGSCNGGDGRANRRLLFRGYRQRLGPAFVTYHTDAVPGAKSQSFESLPTLSLDGKGDDLGAGFRCFLDALGLAFLLEPIEVQIRRCRRL